MSAEETKLKTAAMRVIQHLRDRARYLNSVADQLEIEFKMLEKKKEGGN